MSKNPNDLSQILLFQLYIYCRAHLSKISAIESLLFKLDNLYNFRLYKMVCNAL
jgi:hypothetical protein